MKSFLTRPRTLVLAGLVLLAAGALDPLEGSVVILLGSAVSTLGAFLSHDPRRALPLWGLVFIAVGVSLLFGFSAIGGVGGNTGRSIWWLLAVLPYPIGWVLALVGVARILRQPSAEHRIGPGAQA